tara:strand:- start:56 stop:304 length:249 start_codon:yes stop_codon:yes gene_type:complete
MGNTNTVQQQLTAALEREAILLQTNKGLRRRLAAYEAMNTAGRQRATALHNRTTKQTVFSNYEVKKFAQSIMDALTKSPLLK